MKIRPQRTTPTPHGCFFGPGQDGAERRRRFMPDDIQLTHLQGQTDMLLELLSKYYEPAVRAYDPRLREIAGRATDAILDGRCINCRPGGG